MRHWTYDIADNYKCIGYKYAIFDRRSFGDGYHKGINDLEEMYDFLDMAYKTDRFTKEKDRVALSPDNKNEFLIMYYSKDGTFWVEGRIITLIGNPLLGERWVSIQADPL